MEAQSIILSTAAGGLAVVLSLALEVALLVVALGPVQKHRPEATGLLAGAAGLQLLATVLWFPASFLMRAGVGVESYMKLSAVVSLVLSLVRGAGGVLLLLGLLRLAVPSTCDPTRHE